MNYSTRVALGVKDSHLELDEKHFAEPIEDQGDRIVVHLVQSYPLSCPHCGQPMLKNGLSMHSGHHYTISRRFGRFGNKNTSVDLPMTVRLQSPSSLQSRILTTATTLPGLLSNGP